MNPWGAQGRDRSGRRRESPYDGDGLFRRAPTGGGPGGGDRGVPLDPQTGRAAAAEGGDLYVRDNPMMNQDLTRYIEAHGGEVVVTPAAITSR